MTYPFSGDQGDTSGTANKRVRFNTPGRRSMSLAKRLDAILFEHERCGISIAARIPEVEKA